MSSDEDHKQSGKENRWSGGCHPCHVFDAFLAFLRGPDEELPEVRTINNYAVFIGYLSMAVRGLVFLVVTWTTVVLLGGFVSVLGKKDFWCLTVITLSQTVGVFDVFVNEKLKLGRIWRASRGLFITIFLSTVYGADASSDEDEPNIVIRMIPSVALQLVVYFSFWIIVILAKAAVQALLFVVILLPLATLYVFGLSISTSISLWRLIQHDYGDDVGANMKPALNVLYSLVVVQGLVYGYKIIFACQEKIMIQDLEEKLSSKLDVCMIRNYLRETVTGCEKDPSFAEERNLITYAMDLIESRSAASYLSGTKILDMLLGSDRHGLLIKQLIACGGSSYVLEKLLGTLGPKSPYCGETRWRAGSIVARLASQKQISLAQFPGKEEDLIGILVDNFIDVNRENSNTHPRVDFAGRELAELSRQSKSSAQLILRANDAVAAGLITIVEKKARGSSSAEEILNNLCSHYSKDDECFHRLKKALTDAMSKVLTEMLPQLGQEIRTETEAHNSSVFSPPGEDLEIGCESHKNTRNREKGEGCKLKGTLTFFCLLAKVCDKLISADDQDLSRQFDEITAMICLDSAKPIRTLASLVQEAHEALEEVKA